MNRQGELGEQYAAKYLTGMGYEIISQNFHTPYGEIDIIASKNEYICFVEVKTRSKNSIARPAAAVNVKKQQKIIKSAMIYLSQNCCDFQPRFDVIEVITGNTEKFSVEKLVFLEGAFIINEANRCD